MKRILVFLILKICLAESAESTLSEAIQQMTANLYQEVAKSSANENIVISPLSIHTAMSILLYGAEGYSRGQLHNALGLRNVSKSDHLNGMREIFNVYEDLNDENITLNIANAVYGAKGLQVKPDFTDFAEKQFDAKVATLDFSDKKNAVRVINDWAAKKTNNLINELVSEEGLDKDVQMVIMNAVYFKAKWLNPFNVRGTGKKTFNVSPIDSIETDFMFLEEDIASAHIAELNATLVALPYIDNYYQMLIFHPDESSSIEDLEQKLFSSSKTIDQYMEELKPKASNLYFPKFETGSDLSLVTPFKNLKVTDIFGDRANFKGISDANNIKVGDIIHKTKIIVSEEGSEAAAVTGAVLDTRSGPLRLRINIDSPFIFYIHDTRRNIPLFMGRIVNPSMEKTEPLESVNDPLETEKIKENNFDLFDTKSTTIDEEPINFEGTTVRSTEKSSSKVCPGGNLETCTDGCDFEDSRLHRICIRSCAKKCPD
eukprot:GFUD01037491.1.p1 GENE.GFUD01037491.1~~GFUD01037491.1.p1  ORF type:complete len:486 (-),score=126.64 GFUD01037491.1:215-1672(-)